MHPRHRSPGNGYRSGPMGMRGISSSSRIAPESSIRGGQGMFNYRNYSDGFGRRPPPTQVGATTPPRRPDVFAEAGRLAAEYLVSRGVLPQDVFNGKWQSNNFKNLMGNFRGSKSYSQDQSRLKSNGSDLGRETGRSSSFSEKAKKNIDLEEKRFDGEACDVGKMSFHSKDVKSASHVTGESQSVVDNFQNSDYVASDQDEKVKSNEGASMHDCAAENEPVNDSSDNILSLSSFSKVPTKTRSMRGSKGDLVPLNVEQKAVNNCDDGPLPGSEVISKDVFVDDSSVIETPNQVQGSKSADLDSVKQTPEAGELDQTHTHQEKVTRSQSLPLSSFMNVDEKNENFLGIGRCSSMIVERGEKRKEKCIEDAAIVKKPRECESIGEKNVEASEYTQEMQLFPGSFKICDLNTVEASQRKEISDPNPILSLPSITESKNEIGLSANSNRSVSSTYSRHGANGKEIEVIDLDGDCLQVDNVFEGSERKEDTVFSGAQNDYDLMMSDFLANDIGGSGNVNSLPNDMALDNGEGILGDDESIYMSLGEIPISMPEI